MPPLADHQGGFAKALLDAQTAPPAGVFGPGGTFDAKRFNVYRNNVMVGLVESLAATYPAVLRLVGDEFFRAAAGVFVRQSPPTSPVLMEYGADFADFLDNFEPARSVSYLSDVARLEWAWTCAYFASDAGVLTPAQLTELPPGQLGETGFVMHPATRIIRSRFPVVSLFKANRDGNGHLTGSLPAGGEDALVTRPDMDVQVTALAAGEAAFFNTLATGEPLGSAAENAQEEVDDFDLSGALAKLLQSGAASAPVQPLQTRDLVAAGSGWRNSNHKGVF